MKKFKIAYIIYELNAGGQERQMVFAIKSLMQNGIKPILFIWDETIKSTQDYNISSTGIEIIRLKGNSLKKIYHIRSEIKSREINLIQSWSILLNFISYLSALFSQTHAIGALRSQLFGMYLNYNNIINSLKIFPQLLFTKNIICNNERGALELKEFYKNILLFNKNIFVLRNRCEIPNIIVKEDNSEQFTSISCSSLVPVKNIDFIIEVIQKVVSNYPNIIHYHAGSIGTLLRHLNNLIYKKNLTENFFLIGELNDLKSFYNNANLFINASKFEGTPNAMLEAMSYSLPVISSNWGDVNYYIKNDYNGFIIDKFDSDEWAHNICQLITNKTLPKKMGNNSRRIAEEKIDYQFLFQDLETIYTNILQ